jgi:hypothetical protein
MLRRHFLPLLAQEPATIRVDANLVNLPVFAHLTRDDMEVLEDGVPHSIKHFLQGGASILGLGRIADASES